MSATAEKKLPKKVEEYIEKNSAFNMFGLLNLSSLRAVTGTRLSSVVLKERIRAQYAHQMVNEEIQFIEK